MQVQQTHFQISYKYANVLILQFSMNVCAPDYTVIFPYQWGIGFQVPCGLSSLYKIVQSVHWPVSIFPNSLPGLQDLYAQHCVSYGNNCSTALFRD